MPAAAASLPAGYIDEILDDDSDRTCCAAHSHLAAGADVPPDIIESEAKAMATFTPNAHTDAAEAEEADRLAERERRRRVLRQVDEVQAEILARRSGEPFPVELIEEILHEVKHGE